MLLRPGILPVLPLSMVEPPYIVDQFNFTTFPGIVNLDGGVSMA